ncbi:hypothetical protein ANCCAN_02348 [Ancylostoma caninum]|uniref:Uncharacterized protein n=1 Tax=Ancylostoma caninum TaxID=29170 RepID=A0A368H7I3_ANCCA|nr:hypothetical protein ANCCAN_02348 [Ancylostoma caninum]
MIYNCIVQISFMREERWTTTCFRGRSDEGLVHATRCPNALKAEVLICAPGAISGASSDFAAWIHALSYYQWSCLITDNAIFKDGLCCIRQL